MLVISQQHEFWVKKILYLQLKKKFVFKTIFNLPEDEICDAEMR